MSAAGPRDSRNMTNPTKPSLPISVQLTIASLLSILLFSFHLADDIVRGFEEGQLSNLTAIPIFVVWLYAALLLNGRRSGYVIALLASLLSLGAPILHFMGKGVGPESRIASTDGQFFFVWTTIALGVTGLYSAILALRGLWSLRSVRSP